MNDNWNDYVNNRFSKGNVLEGMRKIDESIVSGSHQEWSRVVGVVLMRMLVGLEVGVYKLYEPVAKWKGACERSLMALEWKIKHTLTSTHIWRRLMWDIIGIVPCCNWRMMTCTLSAFKQVIYLYRVEKSFQEVQRWRLCEAPAAHGCNESSQIWKFFTRFAR